MENLFGAVETYLQMICLVLLICFMILTENEVLKIIKNDAEYHKYELGYNKK